MCHETLICHHITLKVALRQLRLIRPTTSQERFVGGTATETEKKQGGEEEHRTSNGCRSEGRDGRGSVSCMVHVTRKVLWRRRDEEQGNWVIGAVEGQTELLHHHLPPTPSLHRSLRSLSSLLASLSEEAPNAGRRWPTLADADDGGLSRMTSSLGATGRLPTGRQQRLHPRLMDEKKTS